MVIILVSGTFLAQSQYYSAQTLDVDVHDNARVATERLASEIRSSAPRGFIVAGPRTLTIRSPIVVAGVCDRAGNDVFVQFEGGSVALDTDEVAGVAVREPLSGYWAFRHAGWTLLNGGSSGAAAACAANGADTVAASGEFHELQQLGTLFPAPPNPGDLLMLFRESTFTIQPSALDTMTLGLYRQRYGGSAIEFATGMDTTAKFQYRTGGSTYVDTVTSLLNSIDAVRIVADARLPARSSTLEDATFGWSVNIAVRNGP